MFKPLPSKTNSGRDCAPRHVLVLLEGKRIPQTLQAISVGWAAPRSPRKGDPTAARPLRGSSVALGQPPLDIHRTSQDTVSTAPFLLLPTCSPESGREAQPLLLSRPAAQKTLSGVQALRDPKGGFLGGQNEQLALRMGARAPGSPVSRTKLCPAAPRLQAAGASRGPPASTTSRFRPRRGASLGQLWLRGALPAALRCDLTKHFLFRAALFLRGWPSVPTAFLNR